MCENLILFKEGKRKDRRRENSLYPSPCLPACCSAASFSRYDGFNRNKHYSCSNQYKYNN